MKKYLPRDRNEGARQMVYSGAILCVLGVFTLIESLTRIISLRVWPCAFLGLVFVVVVVGLIAYNYIPKRFIMPIGIIGWILAFSILAWMVWYNPLAWSNSNTNW
jgi:hypothetical protein